MVFLLVAISGPLFRRKTHAIQFNFELKLLQNALSILMTSFHFATTFIADFGLFVALRAT